MKRTGLLMLGLLTVLSIAVVPATPLATAGASDSWQETMLASRTKNGETTKTLDEMMLNFPVQMDWMIQDNGLDLTKWFKATDTDNATSMIKRVLLELGDAGQPFHANLDTLVNGKVPGNDRRWLDLYVKACEKRRTARLKNLLQKAPNVDNWAGTQSAPEMLPPYFAGAAKSKLIAMLAKGHEKVKLSTEELEKLAAWIDLYVPYCGDYTEANAWSNDEVKKYSHFMEKRKMMEEQTQRNIDEFIKNKPNQ